MKFQLTGIPIQYSGIRCRWIHTTLWQINIPSHLKNTTSHDIRTNNGQGHTSWRRKYMLWSRSHITLAVSYLFFTGSSILFSQLCITLAGSCITLSIIRTNITAGYTYLMGSHVILAVGNISIGFAYTNMFLGNTKYLMRCIKHSLGSMNQVVGYISPSEMNM
jgi:hypothetical protein